MKNVIVFTVGSRAYAVELRWIREVFTFGHVTPIPLAPPALVGVVNFRGAILPVLDVNGLDGQPTPSAVQGQCGLLVEVDRQQFALRAGTVDEVSSLVGGDRPDRVIDSRSRMVELLSPPDLFAQARSLADRVLDSSSLRGPA